METGLRVVRVAGDGRCMFRCAGRGWRVAAWTGSGQAGWLLKLLLLLLPSQVKSSQAAAAPAPAATSTECRPHATLVLTLRHAYCHRCSALAQGLARNQGRFLGGGAEEQEAGECHRRVPAACRCLMVRQRSRRRVCEGRRCLARLLCCQRCRPAAGCLPRCRTAPRACCFKLHRSTGACARAFPPPPPRSDSLPAEASPPHLQTSFGWRWQRRCAVPPPGATSLRRRCMLLRRRTRCRSEYSAAAPSAVARGFPSLPLLSLRSTNTARAATSCSPCFYNSSPVSHTTQCSAPPHPASQLATHPATHPCSPPPRSYCRRIMAPTFWGGEPELLVLSQMLRVPILVYIPAREAGSR